MRQQLDGAFGHDRRAGHRVEDGALVGGGFDEALDDGAVDLVEVRAVLVHVVERNGVADHAGGGMPGGAEEPALDRGNRVACGR